MLVKESHADVATKADGEGSMSEHSSFDVKLLLSRTMTDIT